MTRIAMMVAAAAIAGGAGLALGSSEARAQSQYGYQFCAIQYYNSMRDCRYSTWDQCQMTASPNGYCMENPAYTAARQARGGAPAPYRVR